MNKNSIFYPLFFCWIGMLTLLVSAFIWNHLHSRERFERFKTNLGLYESHVNEFVKNCNELCDLAKELSLSNLASNVMCPPEQMGQIMWDTKNDKPFTGYLPGRHQTFKDGKLIYDGELK